MRIKVYKIRHGVKKLEEVPHSWSRVEVFKQRLDSHLVMMLQLWILCIKVSYLTGPPPILWFLLGTLRFCKHPSKWTVNFKLGMVASISAVLWYGIMHKICWSLIGTCSSKCSWKVCNWVFLQHPSPQSKMAVFLSYHIFYYSGLMRNNDIIIKWFAP